MKLSFKINKKETNIKEFIKVPKEIIKAHPIVKKNKFPNLLSDIKKNLNKTFNFDYNEKSKSISSLDTIDPAWHGIYKKTKLKEKLEGFDHHPHVFKSAFRTGEMGIVYAHFRYVIEHHIILVTEKANKYFVKKGEDHSFLPRYSLVNDLHYYFSIDFNKDFVLYDSSRVYMDFVK